MVWAIVSCLGLALLPVAFAQGPLMKAQGPLMKVTVIDRIEILENGTIQVRRATYIMENGNRVAGPNYHRAAYMPGADVSKESSLVQKIAVVVWTPEILAAYKARGGGI